MESLVQHLKNIKIPPGKILTYFSVPKKIAFNESSQFFIKIILPNISIKVHECSFHILSQNSHDEGDFLKWVKFNKYSLIYSNPLKNS